MSARPAPAMAIGSSNNSTNQRQQEAPADTPKSKKKQQMQEQLMMLASNKRSRLELLGAQNDHNYSSVTRAQSGSGSGKQPQQQNENKAGAGCDERQQREEALQADGSSGRMDDCTAAMVLMFLSSRPGEPPQAESQSQLQELPVAVDAALELSSKPKNLFAKSGSLASSNSSRCPNENHNNNNNNNNNNNTRQQQPVQPRGKPELSHDHHYQRHLELELELKLRRLAPLQPTVPGRPAIVLNDREEGAEFGAGELLLAEEEEEDDEQVGSGSATGPKTSGQAKDAKMSKLRNSQPIEMQSADSNNLQGRTRRTSATSGKYLAMLQPLHHHQRQPKRPHGLDCDAMASLKRTSVLGRPVAAAFRGGGGGGGHRLVLDEDQEEEEEDECELAFVETSPSKVEDEMIFELQQVDQVGEVGQAAASQSAEWANGAQTSRQPEASERDEHELRFTKKRAKVTAGQLEAAAAAAAANVESSSDKRLRANKLGDVEELAAKKGCEPATGSDRNRACDRPAEAEVGLGAEEHKPSSRKEQLSAEPAEDDEEQAMKELANEHEHEHNPDEEQAHEHELGEASREAFQLAEAELLRFGSMRQQLQAEQLQLQLQQHKHQHQLQPVKMRTIFSCMWPSCSKNCDSLEDIERHVRTHLGSTKQYDSIGDEDFYYEETEVDEPTYLTIFGRESLASSAQRPGVVVGGGPRGCAGSSSQHNSSSRGGKSGGLALSPSHNSDGLSSGHSFASSSPATSPVCSTDSSPPSSASSSSSSSSLSYHHYHRNHQNHLYASAASSVANSIDWNQFLAGSSSMAAFEQQHFLAGTSKGLNGATAKNQHVHLAPISMMPLGNGGGSGSSKTLTATEGNYLMQQQQQQQIYHQQLTTGSAGSPFRFALAGSDQLGQEVFKAKSRRPQATTTTTTKHNSNQNLASQQHQHQMSGSLQFSMQLSGGTGGSQPATSPHSPPLHYTGAIYRGAQPEGRFSQQPNGNTTKQKFQAICRANQSQQQRRGRRPKQQQQQEAGNKTAQPRTTTTKTNHQQHQQIFQHNLMNEPQTKCNSNLKPRNLKSTSAPSSTPTPTQQQQQNYQAHTSTTTTSMQNSSAATSTTTTTSYSNSPLPLIRAKVGVGACGDQPPTTTDYEEDDSSSLSAYSSQQQQQQQQRRQLFNQPTPHTLNTAAASKPARRARGENRKCRKVYGMERRDQWCTQCKWKKACTRFGLELAAIGGTVEG